MKNPFLQLIRGTFALALLLANGPGILQAQNADDLEALIRTSKTRAALVQKVQKAVVHIKVEKFMNKSQGQSLNNPLDLYNEEFFKRFFPGIRPPQQAPQQPFRQEGMGSGSIISNDGYILTNHHVVGEADRIRVKLYDGSEVKARLIGTDPESDIAVIKIDRKNLYALPVGNSKEILVGESVIAVGNPFGLTQTVTFGIVSAKGRTNVGINEYENFIQTDAAINPGNSGGPLVNLRGEIIGVNSAIFTRSGGYQGIGFAVPINMARRIMEDLIEKGSVSRGWLGVGIQDINEDLAQAFKLDKTTGSLITGVMKNTPADRAGLKRGDVVVELNKEPITNSNQLRNEIANAGANSEIELKIIRDSNEMYFTLRLDERPKQLGRVTIKPAPAQENPMGLVVEQLTAEMAEEMKLDVSSGVVIKEVKPNSPAASVGLAAGMIIQEINRQPVTTISDFNQIAASINLEEGVLLLVSINGSSRFVTLKK